MPSWPAELTGNLLQHTDGQDPDGSATTAPRRTQLPEAGKAEPGAAEEPGRAGHNPEFRQETTGLGSVLLPMEAARDSQHFGNETQLQSERQPRETVWSGGQQSAPTPEVEPPTGSTQRQSGQASADPGTRNRSGAAAEVADRSRLDAASASLSDDRTATPHATVPDEDPITLMQQRLLEATGLLARQSEISESIILMEQQLKQAELITKLMAILGPDIPIEVLPGEFRNYGSTPAGQRISAEIAVRKAQDQAQLIRMQMELVLAEAELRRASNTAVYATPPVPAAESPPEPVPESGPVAPIALVVHEISGQGGDLEAVVEWDGERRRVRAGSIMRDGAEIIAIDAEGVEIVDNGKESRFEIGY